MFTKSRLEALSDGVFAIAMTLLILDIKIPPNASGHLSEALAKDFHAWISFVVTFVLTSIFWTAQHRVFDLVEKVTKATLISTFVFLGFVSALPFSTSLWGHYIKEPLAVSLYFANQFSIAAALTTKVEIARAHRNLRLGVAADLMRIRLYFMSFIMLAASVASFVVPLQWIWPIPLGFGLIGRLIRRRLERRRQAKQPPN